MTLQIKSMKYSSRQDMGILHLLLERAVKFMGQVGRFGCVTCLCLCHLIRMKTCRRYSDIVSYSDSYFAETLDLKY